MTFRDTWTWSSLCPACTRLDCSFSSGNIRLRFQQVVKEHQLRELLGQVQGISPPGGPVNQVKRTNQTNNTWFYQSTPHFLGVGELALNVQY